MFEQSLLLNHDGNKPWNFVASLATELLVVSLVILIPLAYIDRLPSFHWRDIALKVAPAPIRIVDPTVARNSGAMSTLSPSVRRPIFRLDTLTSSARVPNAPASFSPDAPPSIGFQPGGDGAIASTQLGTVVVAPPPPPKPIEHPTKSSEPLRVGGTVQMAKLIRKVIPEYPALAKMSRISGVVHLIGTIGKDGAIKNLQLIGGHPMLARAAMEAVQQWVYQPTLLNGEPVEVIAPIEVSFTLGH